MNKKTPPMMQPVVTRAKSMATKGRAKLASFRQDVDLVPADVQAARDYIKDYWQKLERFHPNDDESLVGLPKPYLVPSYAEGHEFDYEELYYWDSYFMVQGMLDKEHQELVEGILEDLISMFKRFKIIPNGSRLYYTSRTQPPLLTSFIFDVYQTYDKNKTWLKDNIAVAKHEYSTVWMGTRKPNARQVYRGLSRYYDFNYLHDIAEAESGWDMTPRFGRKALNYLPADLNALLYKYEMDFARAARIFGDLDEAIEWERAAETRKQTMKELMWDRLRGLYYDYNFVKEKRGNVSSLASYYALWAGMVDEQQARQMQRALKRFENKGGLATTDTLPLAQQVLGGMPTQWAYPNGWAPLHLLVTRGLERYGFHEDAHRIAMKWLKTNLNWFVLHGIFLEKYNVVSPDKPPAKGVYPSQTGFGWSNAVFERLCQDYIDR
jgi:alpha,alpha-trehalase